MYTPPRRWPSLGTCISILLYTAVVVLLLLVLTGCRGDELPALLPPIAAMPEWVPWFAVIAIGVALVALVGLLLLLRGMRELRSGLADELKRELAAAAEPSRVSVDQPLEVRAAVDFVKREEHQALAKKMDDELGRERSSRKRIHEEISTLQGDVRVLDNAVKSTNQKLGNLDQKMDQVLLRLPRPHAS